MKCPFFYEVRVHVVPALVFYTHNLSKVDIPPAHVRNPASVGTGRIWALMPTAIQHFRPWSSGSARQEVPIWHAPVSPLGSIPNTINGLRCPKTLLGDSTTWKCTQDRGNWFSVYTFIEGGFKSYRYQGLVTINILHKLHLNLLHRFRLP